MSYVDTILQRGEVITHRAYLHWIIYDRAVVLALIAGFLWWAGWMTRELGRPAEGFEVFMRVLGLFVILVAALYFLKDAIDYWTTKIAVTNQRVIMKRGVIRRDTIEINMPQVESVDVRQSVLGRLLNYGTVIVRGTGGSLNPLKSVSAICIGQTSAPTPSPG